MVSCATKSTKKYVNIDLTNQVLTCKGFENLELGTPFKEIKKRFSDFKFKEEQEFWGYILSDTDSKFKIFLTVYNDTLQGITISDTNFRFYNGLKPGDEIIKVKQLYPNTPITYNLHDESEQFVIQDNYSTIIIDVISNNNSLIGKYKNELPDSTLNYNDNGRIISIGVFRK